MPQLRRREHHANARTRSHHLAGRPDTEAGNRRGNADAAISLRRPAGPRRRLAGCFASLVGPQSRAGAGGGQLSGALKVVTSKLKPGYLSRNGIPYSANATVTEYYDRIDEPSGNTYLVITTTVDDPMYLTQPYLTATHFKKQADASGWNPTPCAAR